ncbi:programmed cell death 1 ligand 1-like isoform X1 [Myripristis murdjan]|uniref:programmed cell death 1 ligand 1-like isoform X1 n=1 Tax=Myripristis murdjan TaxID=586833 RepID=UPI00117623CE|nr:programmed cell death 1 ligand 1-like isoform X1 [Myripristis murdjan]
MASLRSASLLALSSLICHLAASCKEKRRDEREEAPNLNQNLKARPGHNITLSCQAPDGVDITVAEWRRTDLKELEPVFLYRDGHIDSENQHPSFKNRVELIDGEMKNGNLSVILKNVTEYDNGTYECRIKAAGAKRMKRAIIKTKPISTIQLEVVDPDPVNDCDRDEAARSSQAAAAVVPVLILVLSAVAVLLCRKQKASVEHRK